MSDVCALCRQSARSPIRQSCCHVLCFECGCAIKRQEIDHCFNQAQFKINCPMCSQPTVFSDIHQLMIQEKNNKYSSQQIPQSGDQCSNLVKCNSKSISEYSKYKNLKQSSAVDYFSKDSQQNWFTPSYSQEIKVEEENHFSEDKVDAKCFQQIAATPICNDKKCESPSEDRISGRIGEECSSNICERVKEEVSQCNVVSEAKVRETQKGNIFCYPNCSSNSISPERQDTGCELAKQSEECETEEQRKRREFVETKYSYFMHEEITSKIERLQKGLEKGSPLKCEEHGEFSTLYDTVQHELKCPMCVFEEDCRVRNQIAEGCGQTQNLCFPQQSGFSRVAPAKVCQDNMKKDIHDWECYLEKKLCDIEKSIQNAVLNQGVLREGFAEETRVLKASFEELRQKLSTREIELSENLSKRYAEENEHLKRISAELQPLRDKLRITLRHFLKNLSLDETMNQSYYHAQLNEIRKIICQLKRQQLQLYSKCSSQILSLDLKEQLSSYLMTFGRVDSFVLKGFENCNDPPTSALKSRSASLCIDKSEDKCQIATNGCYQGQKQQQQQQVKYFVFNYLKQSQTGKSDYDKIHIDNHCAKPSNDCKQVHQIQNACSMTPLNNKGLSEYGTVQASHSLPPCKMDQKCPSNFDHASFVKSPVNYAFRQDFTNKYQTTSKDCTQRNWMNSSHSKSKGEKNNDRCSKKSTPVSQRQQDGGNHD